MELIFLHGPPAVGKLTVARALVDMIPARLMDNHATIDLARTVFDFGAPGFWDLVYTLRLDMLEAAARSDLPYLITTGCYDHPDGLPVVAQWEEVLHRHAARLRPVYLTCTPEQLAQRVVHPDRATQGKLNTISGLKDYLARNDFLPLPRPDCVTVDTGTLSAQRAAAQIVRTCALHPAELPPHA